jgi:sugar phosphate isomerase/epimerase
MTRRDFIAAQAAAAAVGESLPKIAIFSKHLQWLDIPAMADAAKEAGFQAIDLTVRPGGHIEPERAPVELPRAAEEIRKRGLELAMITTAIQSVETPHADAVLRAAVAAKVPFFRWGGLRYGGYAPQQAIQIYRGSARRLCKVAADYGVCGVYHTHSGTDQFGAAIWDIYETVRNIDHRHLGINYDIGHATVEGGFGGWEISAKLCAHYMRGIAVKDFVWAKNEKGEWRPRWCPLGEGMVDLKSFFANHRAPVIQVHFEYPIGGAEHGDRAITWSRDQVLQAMRRDLQVLRPLVERA